MFWGVIPTFAEVTGEKLVGGPFCSPPPPHIILNRVNHSISVQYFIYRRLGIPKQVCFHKKYLKSISSSLFKLQSLRLATLRFNFLALFYLSSFIVSKIIQQSIVLYRISFSYSYVTLIFQMIQEVVLESLMSAVLSIVRDLEFTITFTNSTTKVSKISPFKLDP